MLFSLHFCVSLLYRSITVLSSVLYETFKNFFGVLGGTVPLTRRLEKSCIWQAKYVPRYTAKTKFLPFHFSYLPPYIIRLKWVSHLPSFALRKPRNCPLWQFPLPASFFDYFATIFGYITSIFSAMDKPFFSALDSPPFDFYIRKSHGFYSVRLLIFIQLFSTPLYSDGRFLFMHDF